MGGKFYDTDDLKYGDFGVPVEELQRKLNLYLNAGLGIDGSFGPQTEDALIRMQTMLKHGHATGIAGELERELLSLKRSINGVKARKKRQEAARREEGIRILESPPPYAESAEPLYYVFISESGNTTCRKCSANHLRIMSKAELNVGGFIPPLHPNCKCTLVPVEDSMAVAMLSMDEYDAAFIRANVELAKLDPRTRIKIWAILD